MVLNGPLVEYLQNFLNLLGYFNSKINGIFDKETEEAVIKFQEKKYLIQDGIVGPKTWNALTPYINGGLGFIIPTNINYSYSILQININTLKTLYPFINITSAGKSVLGNDIPVIKIGNGPKEVFYSAAIHANEWITTPLLMKFLSDYCYSYFNNLNIYGIPAKQLYNTTTLYIMPMINPDGVSLVTGEINSNSSLYSNTKFIANNYPNIAFPNGWKANIRGVDLKNFQSLCVPCKY